MLLLHELWGLKLRFSSMEAKGQCKMSSSISLFCGLVSLNHLSRLADQWAHEILLPLPCHPLPLRLQVYALTSRLYTSNQVFMFMWQTTLVSDPFLYLPFLRRLFLDLLGVSMLAHARDLGSVSQLWHNQSVYTPITLTGSWDVDCLSSGL